MAPVPVPDYGAVHCAVVDEKALVAMERVFVEVGKLAVVRRTDEKATRQVFFNDGSVLMLVKQEFRDKHKIAGNGHSFPVRSNEAAIARSREILTQAGFSIENFVVDEKRGIVAFKSDALLNNEVAFRPHLLWLIWGEIGGTQ
jgi:hypothetical protein